jgi:hypothetical protein
MTNETTEPSTVEPASETSFPLDEIPRRGIDWELFWTAGGFQIQRVDSPDEREAPVFSSDDEAISFVLYWACEPEVGPADPFYLVSPEDEVDPRYGPVQQECREALRELVASWDPLFVP